MCPQPNSSKVKGTCPTQEKIELTLLMCTFLPLMGTYCNLRVLIVHYGVLSIFMGTYR